MTDFRELTRGERIGALRRDQERMRLPEGYDGRAVVLAALERMRKKREERLRTAVERAKQVRALRRASRVCGLLPHRIGRLIKRFFGDF